MFLETWRKHWGLTEAPFVHEDADKDPVLARMEALAVHSSFERLFGEPTSPVPGIVFGEKGSGKSGLRLAMVRALRKHNAEHPDQAAFVVQHVDFDPFLESLRRAEGIDPDHKRTTEKVLEKHGRADHLDALLSVSVTALVDELIADKPRARRLNRTQRRDLMVLCSLYYRSETRTGDDALKALGAVVGHMGGGLLLLNTLRVVLSLCALAIALVPHARGLGLVEDPSWDPGRAWVWYACGGALLAFVWAHAWIGSLRVASRGNTHARAVRVVPSDRKVVARTLARAGKAAWRELPLPRERGNEEPRYQLLRRFLGVLEGAGYRSLHVLVDRVDEATRLGGRAEDMRAFVEPLLEHKLLQLEGMALKLFLPIELSSLAVSAVPEQLKRMRLDKANAVTELRWTGQELLEIANQRIRTVTAEGEAPRRLAEFLDDDLTDADLRDALHELGTPRLCFGFLGELFATHARDLPEDLPAEDPRWRVSRRQFDIQRAAWGDRSRVLRRNLN